MSVFCEDERWIVVGEAIEGRPPLQAVATCSRRERHDGHHCDKVLKVAWTGADPVDCPARYDHGQPPNRAARRGNTTHKPQHEARKFPGDTSCPTRP
jgi:hypothetical protein